MKNWFKKLLETITEPFVSVAVMVDESKRMNLDGSWDKYHERRNQKLMKRLEKRK